MLKKITLFSVFLLLIGVSLTLYLPRFTPNNTPPKTAKYYNINKASLSTPILMTKLLIPTTVNKEHLYGLQVGLFSQLQQAVTKAEIELKKLSENNLTIVKMSDKKRFWYLLIQGPYVNKQSAQQKINNRVSTLIQWPLSSKNQKGTQ